jgi:hypothetical protein
MKWPEWFSVSRSGTYKRNAHSESAGLRPKSDCSGKAQKQLFSNLQTRPLGATKLQTSNCLNEISRRKQTLVNCPRLGSIPRHTDWLIVSRNVTLTLTLRPPLWSSGQRSWLQNGDLLCFLWGTNWIYICYVEESRPPLWFSGQSSCLQNGDELCFLWGTNWIYVLCRRK